MGVSGNDTVQSVAAGDSTNCPFTDVHFDDIYHGDYIVEFVYNNNGRCVATDGASNGTLGACGDIFGNGAANGAFNVLVSCGGGGWNVINRYWTNSYGSNGILAYMSSGGNPGLAVHRPDTGKAVRWAVTSSPAVARHLDLTAA